MFSSSQSYSLLSNGGLGWLNILYKEISFGSAKGVHPILTIARREMLQVKFIVPISSKKDF